MSIALLLKIIYGINTGIFLAQNPNTGVVFILCARAKDKLVVGNERCARAKDKLGVENEYCTRAKPKLVVKIGCCARAKPKLGVKIKCCTSAKPKLVVKIGCCTSAKGFCESWLCSYIFCLLRSP